VDPAGEGKELQRRCAWCGRFHVRDRWLAATDASLPAALLDRIEAFTHGICPDCFAALERERLGALGRA
jgi:hypothetical protein